MKRFLRTLAACLFAALLFVFAGCSAPAPAPENGKLQVVATIFPAYDWVRQIVGERTENVEVTLLVRNGVDLHSYQPTADDLIRIASCDLFVYVGGTSDAWVSDALARNAGKGPVVIDLMDVLDDAVKEEELVEGMEAEEEDGGEDEIEYDEHVWLSLRNAETFCKNIADALCDLDPDGREVYRANADAYLEKLASLDAAYAAAVKEAPKKTLLFGDRFPFRYLADDYGLTYYAAFVGCSAETEASFQTVVFLANKVDELDIHAILQIESANGSLAATVRDNTQKKDAAILTLDSLQSVTAKEIENGATYLSVMENNLGVLTDALQ